MLDGYGKKALIQDAVRAMEILNENEVQTTGAFILGAMNETTKTADDTIRFAKSLNPRKAQFSILTPYPGAKLYERVRDRLLTDDWGKFTALDPVIRLDHLSSRQLSMRLLKAYSSFYLRPRKAIENMHNISNVIPGLFKWFAPRLGQQCLEFSRLLMLYRRVFASGKYG